jgi:hypothetical protein
VPDRPIVPYKSVLSASGGVFFKRSLPIFFTAHERLSLIPYNVIMSAT